MTVRDWEQMTTTDFAGLDAERAVAVLPVAAVEQHGPHLPLGTDAMICEAVTDAALGLVDDGVEVLRLPIQRIGTSGEHAGFPGTLSIEPEPLAAAWSDIGRSVARAGIRRLVVFNSHGGQPQVVDIAALRLRRELGMLVARANIGGLGLPDGLIDDEERRHGLHGGEIETALMLHVAPHLVRRDRAGVFVSAATRIVAGSRVLEAEGATGIAWTAEDLNPAGVTGNAGRATAATGRTILDHLAARLAALIEDLTRLPLPDFSARSAGASAHGS